VIAGAPGSGKSGAAVLLVLAALDHRKPETKQADPSVPVPVLFTVQDWDPDGQQIRDWLVLRLQQTYPLFAGKAGVRKAAALIDAGKVAVILDGLDEMTEMALPVALQALSEQVTFRLVVLARTDEMASAVEQMGGLGGAAAVELQNIDPTAAADYLSRVQLDPPPHEWQTFMDRLRHDPGSSLVQALNSPLTLTLIRDTYRRGDHIRELLDFCDTRPPGDSDGRRAEDIVDHLLDRVLPAAYAPRPGEAPPRYDLQTSQRALANIAARMNQDGTRDLEWWRFPGWAPAGWFHQISEFVETGWEEGDRPRRLGKVRRRRVFNVINVAGGLLFGLLVGAVVWAKAGLGWWVAVGTIAGGVFMLMAGVLLTPEAGLDGEDGTSALSPVTSWRSDRTYGGAVGIVVGVTTGVGCGLGVGDAGVGITVAVFFGVGFALMNSRTWACSLASARLAWRWHTPVRLMRFLEDAYARGVLRTVGPVYQFRHARLQDRVAEQVSAVSAQGPPKEARSSKPSGSL
jgi:hypothetical protein